MSDSRRRLVIGSVVMLLANGIIVRQSAGQNAHQTSTPVYRGTFVAHAIEEFGFDETFTVEAKVNTESDTAGTMSFDIALASFPVGTTGPPVRVNTSCSIPLTMSGDAFSGSADGLCWVNVRIEVSGTITPDTMTGTWRLHALLLPPYDDPGYAEDTGSVPFTLTK
jgi:hypothetical protein